MSGEQAPVGREFMVDALCVQTSPEDFFPTSGQPYAAALAVCRGCPVRKPCLEYSLAHDERFGIWGGTTVNERDRLRRARRQADTTTGDHGEAA